MVRTIATLAVGLGLLLGGCSRVINQPTGQLTSTLQPSGVLTPYTTATPEPGSPTPTFIVTIPVTPSPTSTPFLHTITNDDTMLGLAFRYGVSLEALKTANPSVIPNAMTVGSQLVIPILIETTQSASTPSPIPVQAGQPRCYPTGDGGAWCLAAVRNITDTTLENLSVWIGLYNSHGDNFASQAAYAPLDILRSGDTMPLMVYFAGPLPVDYTARSEILTASAINSDDARYLDAVAKIDSSSIDPNRTLAQVTGQVILPQGKPTASQVWVLAIAYDTDGNILGVRKWKSDTLTDFDITVYSLGGVIDHVEVLVEARP